MTKILSLIIPTYNMEKYLDRCLSSLIVEDDLMSELEVLVINDGSMDRSSEIAHGYANRYPDTFVVIDKENGHYGSCVNRGLELATGKYVKILDSDDFFDTVSLSQFIGYLQDNDADLFLSSNRVEWEDGSVYAVQTFPFEEERIYDASAMNECITDSVPHQSVTWRTEILKMTSYRQTEGIAYTDLEWVSRPMGSVSSVMYFPGILYVYRRGREDQTVSPKVHCKNMWMENKVVLGNVAYFESARSGWEEKNVAVVRSLMKHNVVRIYFHYLINFPKNLNNKDLVFFDSSLCGMSPELYSEALSAVEKRKFMKLDYVREWRKGKSRSTLRFFVFDMGNSAGRFLWKLRHRS